MRKAADRGVCGVTPQIVGTSVLGAPIELFLPDSETVDLLLVAGVHGEEPEGTILLSKALRSLARPLNRCGVILAANPDGLARGTRGNANGVDLNRNFPAANWASDAVVHRWLPDHPQEVRLSPGSAPSSEPETVAFLSVIEGYAPKQVVSIHAPLACVDDPDATPLGRLLAERCELPLVEEIGYPTPGSFGSWAIERKQRVITWELPPHSVWEMAPRYLPIIMELMTADHGVEIPAR